MPKQLGSPTPSEAQHFVNLSLGPICTVLALVWDIFLRSEERFWSKLSSGGATTLKAPDNSDPVSVI